MDFIIKGHVCFMKEAKTLEVVENAYLVCLDGRCEGVFRELPEIYKDLPVTDYDDRLIIPGLVDLHVHAPQYSFRGLGMDLELLEWLNQNTFPEEAKYKDMDYADKAYDYFVEDLRQGAVTRACIFATIHNEATILLMDKLEAAGLCTMVGKVNMDRNSPAELCEKSAKISAEDTVQWIERVKGRYQKTKPILTPRFIPSCTDELMAGLQEIQKKYQLPVQSHLSENQSEIEWVKELCKEAEFYGDAYDRFGMFGRGCPTIMAHCVYSTDEEIERMKENGVYIAHCPQSNTNLTSGIASVRRYLDEGMNIGLGSDVAGGSVTSIFRAMADAVQVSKLRWRLFDESLKPLTVWEAFYMGTKGGGSFFGKVGSFEKGYEFDAVVLDDSRLKHPQPLTIKQRLERVIYLSDEREIYDKYVQGKKL